MIKKWLLRFLFVYFLISLLLVASLQAYLLNRRLVPAKSYVAGEKDLKITFIDSGQGEAILIETPGRRRILIDGGINNYRIDDGQ